MPGACRGAANDRRVTAILFAQRSERIHPGRNEKILTSWNALMIKGMARAGRIFSTPGWVASAEQALEFIRSTLWRDHRLLATSKDGHAHLNAYLDDYAFLIDALLELLQEQLNSPEILIVRGSDEQFAQWRSQQQRSYQPARMVLSIVDDTEIPETLAGKKPKPGGVIYCCRGMHCVMSDED